MTKRQAREHLKPLLKSSATSSDQKAAVRLALQTLEQAERVDLLLAWVKDRSKPPWNE